MNRMTGRIAKPLRKSELCYISVGAFSLLLLLGVRFFFDHSLIQIERPIFLLLHTLLELFSIFVSFSIFIQAMITYSPSSKNSNFFLGLVFLAVGLFDLLHTLLYKGMPFLDDEFALARATWFWILARLVESIGVFLVILIPRKLWIGRRDEFVVMTLVVVGVLGSLVVFKSEQFPKLINNLTGITNLKIGLEYIICTVVLLTLIVLIKQYKYEQSIDTLRLMMALFLIIIGELFFTLYTRVFDMENLLGHFYKFSGYAFLYIAIFFPQIKQIVAGKEEAEKQKMEVELMLFEVEKNLSRLVLQAHEEERKRVARELHDGIGQSLYSILVTLNIADNELSEENKLETLQKAKRMTADAMSEVKEIAHSLRPSSLDDLGFLPALKTYIEKFQITYGIQVKLEVIDIKGRLEPEYETALYRICQETLTNAAKYSKADEIHLLINDSGKEITLTILDNGVGFFIEDYLKSGRPKGIGLFSMKERAELLGGTFDIHSEVDIGTRITVQIPKRD